MDFLKNTKCKRYFTKEQSKFYIGDFKNSLSKNIYSNFDLENEIIEINEKNTDVNEKLEELDLLQFSICQSISNVSDINTKKKLLEKLQQTQIQMLELLSNIERNKYTDSEIKSHKMKELKHIKIEGNSNIILQDVNSSTITININDMDSLNKLFVELSSYNLHPDLLESIKSIIDEPSLSIVAKRFEIINRLTRQGFIRESERYIHQTLPAFFNIDDKQGLIKFNVSGSQFVYQTIEFLTDIERAYNGLLIFFHSNLSEIQDIKLALNIFDNSNKMLVLDLKLKIYTISISSPGWWEIFGKLNPLQAIKDYFTELRAFLNERHERKKDKSYRNELEKKKMELEIKQKEQELEHQKELNKLEREEKANEIISKDETKKIELAEKKEALSKTKQDNILDIVKQVTDIALGEKISSQMLKLREQGLSEQDIEIFYNKCVLLPLSSLNKHFDNELISSIELKENNR